MEIYIQYVRYVILYLYDLANLMKLIWVCISSDLLIVDWLKTEILICDFVGCKIFFWNLFFSQSFCLFFFIHQLFFLKKQDLYWFSMFQFMLLTLVFTHCYIFIRFFYCRIMCFPIITMTHKETKITRDILPSVSSIQVCYN